MEPLNLTLSVDAVARLCRQIESNVGGSAQRLAAFTTLATLIATASDSAEQTKAVYTEIRALLDDHAERARAQLIEEQAEALATALKGHDRSAIARIYAPLSRSGFWSVMERLRETTPSIELTNHHTWCASQLAEIKRRGEAASPYPDAIDFKAAGIDITEYTALGDLAQFLQAHCT